ncbi:MAG: tRNA uridine-5-carboxymethylaminomethyl(34) synthesis GTPase MnmE [Tidjanibacter sp.]|nr:tRNA uridine-5-carboxymethylaminomethyl(34) synthesis GTPase MnmE [Tidjanibacter sp.]
MKFPILANDTIVAPATPSGGAIAVVRIEGPRAIEIADAFFTADKGTSLAEMKGYTLSHGVVGDRDRRIDDVVVALFRSPASYTGGNMVEISCHGSAYIVSEIVRLAIDNGARSATPGEFTKRAFLAGKIDLSQAEAVADVIAADSKASLSLADTQLRGGYSKSLASLRGELLRLAALLELELDFSEEDVEFANRGELIELLERIDGEMAHLTHSFATGNAIKKGVGVAIVGKPNVGKSTLLNRILGEDRAMVSELAGTTRDTVEECITIDGVLFRLIDTAGLHNTDDRLENMGIERTLKALQSAQVVVELFDSPSSEDIVEIGNEQRVIRVMNKCDRGERDLPEGWIGISAKYGDGVEHLLQTIRGCVDTEAVMSGETVVSNSRHYAALCEGREALSRAREGLEMSLSSELVSMDVRVVLDSIGTITGEVTSSDILTEIFSKFCIGK